MGLIITRDQYTVQPQGLPGIDRSNRLGGRVRSAVLRGTNLVNGKTATWSGTKKFTGRAPDGLVTSLDGSSYLDLTSVGLYNPATTGVTLAFFSRNATPAGVGGTLRITPSSGGNTFCAVRGTNTTYRLGAGYATGGTLPVHAGIAIAAAGTPERTVITCANGLTSTTAADYEIWVNGTKYTTSGSVTFGAQTAGNTYFGWDGADSKYPGNIDELVVFEGKLSDAEVREYFRNPYQMYARPATRIWFGVSAAGTSVIPDAGTLTFSGFAPTVQQTANTSVSPAAGNLTFTGFAPSVTQAVSVVPDAGSFAFTGFAPTVEQTANVSLTPAAGALTFTGYAPTVTQTGPISVTPDPGNITFTGYAPTVTQTGAPVYIPSSASTAYGGGGGREFRKLVKKIEEDITARVQGTSPAPTPALPKTAVKSSSRIATKEAPPAEQELLQKVRQLEKELHFLAREVEALKVAKQASDENGEEAAIMSILLN